MQTDRIVRNEDTIRLGSSELHALLTPGHTRGCTTWRMTVLEKKEPLDVVFLCSVTAPGYQLVDNAEYPHIFKDYQETFAKLRGLDPDVFLANHAGFYDLTGKRARLNDGGANPFVMRGELARHLDKMWDGLVKQEQEQQSAKHAKP